MAKTIHKLAGLLGAEHISTLSEAGGGAFGAARLAEIEILRDRLEPGRGQRPGRPTVASWDRRPKVPMSAATKRKLDELAESFSTAERRVSPMQVAAQLLEDAVRRLEVSK